MIRIPIDERFSRLNEMREEYVRRHMLAPSVGAAADGAAEGVDTSNPVAVAL